MFGWLKSLFAPRVTNAISVRQLVEQLGLEFKGEGDKIIGGVASIFDARDNQLSFYSREKISEVMKVLPVEILQKTKAGIIVLDKSDAKYAPKNATLIFSDAPRQVMVKILGIVYAEPRKFGIHKTAKIAQGVFFRNKKSVYIGPNAIIEMGAVIEPNVSIGANCFVGRHVSLGDGTVLYPNVYVANATIGKDCVFYPGVVIGKEGFGYTIENGKNVPVPHSGKVIIGERVALGANTCVDRGALSDTIIGEGTKIDNLVQVAHGVVIGSECFIASQSGMAGGAVVGNRVFVGGQVGIANKVNIGDDARLGAQSGIMKDVPAGAKYMGYPAVEGGDFMRQTAWVRIQSKKRTNDNGKKE